MSLQRDYQQNFTKKILPFMGDRELNSLTVETLVAFHMNLISERGLALKTATNIIDGSLRTMIRDAGRPIDRNPFNDLAEGWWPRLAQRDPDPYSEHERDQILDYYRGNRPH